MKKIFLFAAIAIGQMLISVPSVHAQWSTGTDMYNLNTGNVGVGTTTPNGKLNVTSSAALSLANPGIFTVGVVSGNNLAFDNDEIQSRNNGAAASLLLNRLGGNVGIGTSSPSYRFHVNNTTSTRSAHFSNSFNAGSTKYGIYTEVTGAGNGSRYGISNSTTASSAAASTTSALGIYNLLNNPGAGQSWGIWSEVTAGSNQSAGIYNKVTAGVTSSTASHFGLWNVVSNSGSGATWGIYSDATNTSTTSNADVYGLYGTATNNSANGGNSSYGVKGFATSIGISKQNYGVYGSANGTGTLNDSYGVYGTASGTNAWGGYFPARVYMSELHVGSVKSADGYLLTCDGKVICEELRVMDSGDWPDYVFAEDYKLLSLDEVEQNIKTEKHLPGIPSACEMEENGLDVGQMQKMMMEKIEELTLYIIDLKKCNTELNDRLAQLEFK